MDNPIIIIEDDLAESVLLKTRLEQRGHETIIFQSGGDALVWLTSHQPSLVLLDLLLPGTNGFDVCRAIRSLYSEDQLPVLIVSALGMVRDDPAYVWEAGASGFLSKPYTRDQLFDAIRAVQTQSVRRYDPTIQLEQHISGAYLFGEPSPHAAQTVLVAEDDTNLRRVFARVLRNQGYCVLEAADGSQALRTVQANPPDLLVMDFNMPGESANTLLAQVRDQPGQHIPVIVVTGHREANVPDADLLLLKPVSTRELVTLVSRMLARTDELAVS